MIASPVTWIGGKGRLAAQIVGQFPHHSQYDTFVDVLGGGAHVLLQKPAYRHFEIYNDLNNDLVNFWMVCRDKPEALAAQLDSLPYSRELHYRYHASLYSGEWLDPVERAARWFYVLRSSFSSTIGATSNGWKCGPRDIGRGEPHAMKTAIALFTQISERLRSVEIDNRDFAEVITRVNRTPNPGRVLYYVDPPYIEREEYYEGVPLFTEADHRRLARQLNQVEGYIALSYYDDPLLAEFYPSPRWTRMYWDVPLHGQRTRQTHDRAREMLLTNYSRDTQLWEYAGSEAST